MVARMIVSVRALISFIDYATPILVTIVAIALFLKGDTATAMILLVLALVLVKLDE